MIYSKFIDSLNIFLDPFLGVSYIYSKIHQQKPPAAVMASMGFPTNVFGSASCWFCRQRLRQLLYRVMPLFGCISCISSIFPGFNRLKEKNDYMQINVIYTIYIYPIYTTYISRCKSIRECWMKIMNKNNNK